MIATLNQIIKLNNIMAKLRDGALPIKTSYKIAKLTSIVENETEIYKTTGSKLIEKYGLKNDNGDYIPDDSNVFGVKLIEDQIDDVAREYSELLETEVEIPGITFSLDELDGLFLTADECQILFPFIVE